MVPAASLLGAIETYVSAWCCEVVVTDFRRPDLDLWDEEDDGEDARPTIVAERPTDSQPRGGALGAANAGRSSLVKRLIEQGALEDEPPRLSAENLRDSEVDQLMLESPMEAAAARAALLEVESEPSTEDAVPTVSVKRQLPTANTPLPVPMAKLTLLAPSAKLALPAPTAKLTTPPPPRFTDREVTERISIPMGGMAGSIAPATKTFRPEKRSGMPFWQTALAAVVLLGGGLSIAKLRSERKAEISATSMEAPRPTEPIMAPVLPRPEPAHAALAEPPQPAEVVIPAPAVEPPPVVPAPPRPELPIRATPPDSTTTRRARRAERVALAASVAAEAPPPEAARPAPVAIEPAAKPSPAPAPQNLPAQPSREQVTAALSAVVPALKKCVGDRHDTADVTLTVRPAGFVSYAVVAGPYAGSSEGSCIARAVKAAKFPEFSDPTLRVSYPFQL